MIFLASSSDNIPISCKSTISPLTLSLDDAKKITGEGIDYQCLPVNCEEEANRLKRCYWLNDESDFVMLEGIVKSPWCELLLQRFALDYIRVGVDGSTENDYTNLVSLIGKD